MANPTKHFAVKKLSHSINQSSSSSAFFSIWLSVCLSVCFSHLSVCHCISLALFRALSLYFSFYMRLPLFLSLFRNSYSGFLLHVYRRTMKPNGLSCFDVNETLRASHIITGRCWFL